MVIGEDLGTVPEGFREVLSKADIFSYRVLLLEREGARFRPASVLSRSRGGLRGDARSPAFHRLVGRRRRS